ncbi:hypothetical protein HKX48_008994 [Thoreauomyces humboldtii]|nr:hypothetical protein HKX48_008994 [Thoreauomyces humboldtii]
MPSKKKHAEPTPSKSPSVESDSGLEENENSQEDAMSLTAEPRVHEHEEDLLDRAYRPPRGYAPEELSTTVKSPFDLKSLECSRDREVWLIRVPSDVPLSALEGCLLRPPPPSQPAAGSNGGGVLGTLVTHPLPHTFRQVSAQDAGEMANLLPLLPCRSTGSYELAANLRVHRYINLSVEDATDRDGEKDKEFDVGALRKAGEEMMKVANDRAVHPEGMELQSPPFGFDTDGKALELSLARYGKERTELPSTYLRPSSVKASSDSTPKSKTGTPSSTKKRKSDSTTPAPSSSKKDGKEASGSKTKVVSEKKRKKLAKES